MSDNDPGFTFEVNGRSYTLRMKDFSGADDLAVYQKTGCTLIDIFAGGRITLFTLAALLWRHRLRVEPRLTFEQVNADMTFDAIETVTDAEDKATDPEA